MQRSIGVKNKFAEEVRRYLVGKNLIDRDHKIRGDNGYLAIPVIRKLKRNEITNLKKYNVEIIELDGLEKRTPPLTPFGEILEKIALPKRQLKHLPQKWELIGDVLILKIPSRLKSAEKKIGKVYADVLGAKTVLVDTGGIWGIVREPTMRAIYGSDTETMHTENKVKFRLDTAKIMFSSGNNHERDRMAYVSNGNEIVADMFAGIGYFSVPMAVYSKPKRIYAAEINPAAYGYLCANISINKVASIVVPLLGDCRKEMPERIADRVVVGYLHDTWKFLPKAVRVLGENGGIIHYHEKCHDKLINKRSIDVPKFINEKTGRRSKLIKLHNIKSYSPHTSHIVMDILVEGSR